MEYKIIPMTKESIFEEPCDDFEIYGVTEDFEEWVKNNRKLVQGLKVSNFNCELTQEMVEFVSNNFYHFMLRPVAMTENGVLLSQSKRFSSLEEVKSNFEKYTNKVFLYHFYKDLNKREYAVIFCVEDMDV